MRTAATDLVGIDLPLFGFSHCRDVVAAVSNAGGCGVLGAVAHSPEQLDIDLTWIEKEVKGKPYGVDLLVPEKFVGADEGGLDPSQLRGLRPRGAPGIRRRPADALRRARPLPTTTRSTAASARCASTRRAWRRCSTCCFAHKTRLVASALGPPPPHFIERSHGAGIPVAALAGASSTPQQARGGRRRSHRGPGNRGRWPHRNDRDDGPRARGRRRRRTRARARRRRDRAAVGSSPRAWRSAPTACGAARSG